MSEQDGALRTEAEKGTNVGTYDPAVRTEAEKEDAGGGGGGIEILRRRIDGA